MVVIGEVVSTGCGNGLELVVREAVAEISAELRSASPHSLIFKQKASIKEIIGAVISICGVALFF